MSSLVWIYPCIRVPDALQIAAAVEAGATLFITNDQRLTRVQEIRVFVLDDYLP